MSSDVELTRAWLASFVFYLGPQEAKAFIKGDNTSSTSHHGLYLLSPLQLLLRRLPIYIIMIVFHSAVFNYGVNFS